MTPAEGVAVTQFTQILLTALLNEKREEKITNLKRSHTFKFHSFLQENTSLGGLDEMHINLKLISCRLFFLHLLASIESVFV